MNTNSSMTPGKNARVIYAWRAPVMHFFILFCLYKQFNHYLSKHEKDANPP
jgi:hypothetical protein